LSPTDEAEVAQDDKEDTDREHDDFVELALVARVDAECLPEQRFHEQFVAARPDFMVAVNTIAVVVFERHVCGR